MKCASHMENVNKLEPQSTQQQFLQESIGVSKTDLFNKDLCKAFAAADIPFYKLNNMALKAFLEKYMPFQLPSERTLRRGISELYESTLQEIRMVTRNEYLWISIDETTDSSKRCIANVVVGILNCDTNRTSKTFLLNVAVLDRVNHSSIARLFDESVNLLGAEYKNFVLLFVSDAAPYMVKAADGIRIFYPKVIHLTCLAHGLHRVCEKIRFLHPLVDELVATIKKIFLKAPSRIQIFKDMCDLPLPPQPVLTRWGTWIEAVTYYANNFETIENIINSLDSEESQFIKPAQLIFKKQDLKREITFINTNYGCLPKYITKLETSGLPLKNSLDIVKEAKDQIELANNNAVTNKFENILIKNKGYAELQTIANWHREHNSEPTSEYTVSELSAFKYAPITSVDTERTFSMYKNFYKDNRRSFTFDNMSQYFVIYCNNNMK